MTRDAWNSTGSRLAIAVVLAAGLAASPLALGGAGKLSNSAAAQSADIGVGADIGGGGAEVGAGVGAAIGGAEVGADVGADIGGGNDDGGSAGADVGADVDAGGADSGGGTNEPAGSGGASSGEDDGSGGAGETAAASSGTDGGVAATGSVDDTDPPFRRVEPNPYRYFVSMNLETTAFQYYREAAERNDLRAAGAALADATHRPVTVDLVAYVNTELDVQTDLTAPQIAAAANNHPFPEHAGTVGSAADDILADRPPR